MLESYDFRKIQEWIIIEKWEDITKLKSVVNMSSIVFDHFKGDLTTLWYSLRFSDPSPKEIENLPIKRQLYLIAHQIVSDLLFVYLHKYGLVFKSQEAELLQNKWFQFLAKDSINYEAQSILKNVRIDSDQIKLSNVFCIKKLTDSEKKKLRENLYDRHIFGIQIFSQKIDVILQSKWEKNIRPKNTLNLRDPYNRALSIFRLIKPEKLTGFFKRQEDIPKSKQRELWEFLELTPPENHFIKTRDEFEFIPYIKYSCSNCKSVQGYHEQQLLSIEAFEWMRKNPEKIDQLWRNFHINDPEYDLYLFIGNQQIRRTSFMVISILRFKKKNYSLEKIKPLIPLKKVEKF
ncbi:MAG: hypothetical protein ACFE9L_21070 [Candidatus Hodarchaeota archaeon]